MAQTGIIASEVNQEFSAAPGSADGTLVGRNATTKVGFFGTLPVAQPALPTDTASIIAALVALGLVKAS